MEGRIEHRNETGPVYSIAGQDGRSLWRFGKKVFRSRIEVIGRVTGKICVLNFESTSWTERGARKDTEKTIDLTFPKP